MEIPAKYKRIAKDEALQKKAWLYDTGQNPTLTKDEARKIKQGLWLEEGRKSYIGYHDGSCTDDDGSILRNAFKILHENGFEGYFLSPVCVFIPRESPDSVVKMLKNAGYCLWAVGTALWKNLK